MEGGQGGLQLTPQANSALALSRRQLASSRWHLDAICFYGYCAVLLLLLLLCLLLQLELLLQLLLCQCKSMRRIATCIGAMLACFN